MHASIFRISGTAYLVCQFKDRWLIFNYSATLLSSGVLLYIKQFNHYIFTKHQELLRNFSFLYIEEN